VTACIESYYDELLPYLARQRVDEARSTRASGRPVVRLRGQTPDVSGNCGPPGTMDQNV